MKFVRLKPIQWWKIYGTLMTIMLIGIILIVIANSNSRLSKPPTKEETVTEHKWYDAWPSWVEAIGTTLLIAGSLGVIEKALLAGDTLSQIGEIFCVHESTTRLGLQEVSINAGNYDYEDLIEDSPTLRIVMNDGRTWVSSRIDQLQRRFRKQKFTTEVFVIDPSGQFAEIIAAKTEYTKEQQQNKINEAVHRLKDEFEKQGKLGVLKIHYLRFFPTHCIVLGDEEAVFTLYGTSSGRRAVPTFRVKKTDYPGDIWTTLTADVDTLVGESTLHYDSTQSVAK